MADEHNIKTFTATDIEKYHKGLLSVKERHALEKAALEDPFLADALEGYDVSINVNEDLAELQDRLANRTRKAKVIPVLPKKANSFSWWKAAAMFVLVAGAGLLVYQFGFNKRSPEIALAPEEQLQKPRAQTGDSTLDADIAKTSEAKQDQLTGNDSDLTNNAVDIESKNAPATEKKKVDKQAEIDPLPLPNGRDDSLANNKVTIGNSGYLETEANASKPDRQKRKVEKVQEIKVSNQNIRVADGDGAADKFDKPAAASPQAQANINSQKQEMITMPNVFRGRVMDANNNGLPFTNITNLEDTIGTYTDVRGYFVLTSPDSVLNVQVRSLGYETNNIQLKNIGEVNKILLGEDRSLNARVLDTTRRNTNRSRHDAMTLEESEPLDGWSNYDIYIVNNLKAPDVFITKQGGGEVELSFEVDKNGQPINITVKKSLCDSCDKEAIRLIKEGPKWKRKLKKGKTTVTVTF